MPGTSGNERKLPLQFRFLRIHGIDFGGMDSDGGFPGKPDVLHSPKTPDRGNCIEAGEPGFKLTFVKSYI